MSARPDSVSGRLFTVDQVNALLPALRKAARQVTTASRQLEDLAAELYENQPESDTAVAPDYAAAVLSVQAGVEAIQSMGGEIKDLKQGLVDFRSIKDGREVYLCWLPGESRVAFWHDLHAGFAGRTAITDAGEFAGEAPEDDGDGSDDPLVREAD